MSSTFVRKVIDFIITFIIVALVAIALLWFVHTFNVFELPDFIERLIEPETEYIDPSYDSEEELLALIESEEYISGEFSYVSLTADKAKQLLRSIPVAENYYWKVETSTLFGGLSRTQTHSFYKQNGKVRIDTDDNGASFTTIFAGGKIFSINNVTGERSECSGDTDFSCSNVVNVAALESFFNSSKTEVDYVAAVDIGDEKYLYVEIPKESINGSDKYFVSLIHGTVMFASSVIDGVEYFSQRTVEFEPDSVISDSAFEFTVSETGEPLALQ